MSGIEKSATACDLHVQGYYACEHPLAGISLFLGPVMSPVVCQCQRPQYETEQVEGGYQMIRGCPIIGPVNLRGTNGEQQRQT